MNNKTLSWCGKNVSDHKILLTAILFFISTSAFCQVTIVVNKIPTYTPSDDTLYVVGSFNEWNPGDARYRLNKNNDSTFSITMPKGLTSFQYKITRGSWKNVEGDINGKKREDRALSLLNNEPSRHVIQILSWEDMSLYYSWNIIVKKIPDNTPFDASIFISGSFNDWKENDYTYKLNKLDDGTYAIKIPKTSHDTIWFKFHRGNWKSVESRSNGRTQYNRILVWIPSQHATTTECEIAAWEDIGGGSNLFFSFILIASALQAVILILSLLSIKKRNKRVVVALVLLLLLTATALMSRLATYDRFVFDLQPKLLLLADIAYFIYAPTFCLLLIGILNISLQPKYLKWLFAIVPFIHFLLYLKLIVMSTAQFVSENIDGKFTKLFNATAVVATIYNVAVFIFCLYIIIKKQRSIKSAGYQPSRSYIITLMIQTGAVLFVWILSHVIYILGPVLHYDGRIIHEHTIDMLWILFALSTYVHSFLVVRKPELFKLKEDEEDKQKSNFQKENLEVLKNTLTSLMKKQKPYLNSKLSLQDLADLMNVNLHTLSWIINDGYNKNFFDFINDYRIEEFIRLASTEQYKNYTFLAIAMEVGFSSKTTFNRAFKKSIAKTPREYFSDAQEALLKDL